MEEMYFAWLENPQSVHKVGTPCLPAMQEGSSWSWAVEGVVGRSGLPAVCSWARFFASQLLQRPVYKSLVLVLGEESPLLSCC